MNIREKINHKEGESSPEESSVINQYMDIKTGIFDLGRTKEENSDFAQKFVDAVRTLNGGQIWILLSGKRCCGG